MGNKELTNGEGNPYHGLTMTEPQPEATEDSGTSAESDASNGGRQNIRSTIAFPYSSLADAEQVAEALRQRGDEASMDEVAAELNQTTSSGAFRTKVATA